MGIGIYITGTGTDVGKTLVTGALLRLLRKRGIDAVSMKPVQTGALQAGGKLISQDLAFHCEAAGVPIAADEQECRSPFLYEPACSPHLAGRKIGRYPESFVIEKCAASLAEKHEVLLVEGAGGIMSPLDENTTALNLMTSLKFPIIVVSHVGLGAINQSLLTLLAARGTGLDVIGIVFNDPAGCEDEEIRSDNPDIICHLGAVALIANIPHIASLSAIGEAEWSTIEQSFTGIAHVFQAIESRRR